MFDAFFQGLAAYARLDVMLIVLVTVIISIAFGVVPGISGFTAVILFLPFVFVMPDTLALVAMVCLSSVSSQGGSITSILMGIPGDETSVPTLLDGYPLAKKGQAAQAIGAAITASSMGGILSVLFAFLFIPIIVPFVLKFRAPEFFFLVVAGLAFLASLSSGSVLKGLISGAVGFLLAFVGYQMKTGIPRFTFGIVGLYDGIALIAVALGLFALPELIDQAATGQTIAPVALKAGGLRDVLAGVKSVLNYKRVWLTSVVIGYIVGIIPAIGGTVATFMAYGQAKQVSKTPEKFGTGMIEGVIAPESAHNATKAGDLLTTIMFGIPGSGSMTIFLAAFWIMGLTAGPSMVRDRLDIVFLMLIGLAIANVISGVLCFFGAPYLAKLTRVDPVHLFAAIIPVVAVGAFVPSGGVMLNVLVLLAFGIIGLFMKKFGYSRPCLLLCFVMGRLFEYYFWRSFDAFGPLFFVTPISLGLIALIVLLFTYKYLSSAVRRWLKRESQRV